MICSQRLTCKNWGMIFVVRRPGERTCLNFFYVSFLLFRRLVGLEQDLRNISRKQGVTVAHVVDLVNENELILCKMKVILRQIFVSTMVAVITRSEGA